MKLSPSSRLFNAEWKDMWAVMRPSSRPKCVERAEIRANPDIDHLELDKTIDHVQKAKADLGRHKPFRATWALNASQMLYACQQGIIDGPPSVTAKELSDRSKGDFFVKVLAVFQITWLAIQIIARSTEGLVITLMK